MAETTLAAPVKKYRAPARSAGFPSPHVERWINRATIRSPLLRSIVSYTIMPLIWRLGPQINYDPDNFFVECPHNRMNRNSYGTVGGGALLAKLELAAGCYLFMATDGASRIVCRNVSYRFMLPSTNGLHFRVEPLDDDLEAMIARGEPFNANFKVYVYSRGDRFGEKGRRIGRGEIGFHVWPIED